ncbi:TPA: outer membrane beta-barrel protein, partial [Escherichia coli]
NIQLYGWIDPGGNASTSTASLGGNSPAAYDYNPNSLQLDQFVLYLERVPDTVQNDHIDWGFRMSMIYGENYRYTTAYGIASQQLLSHNNVNGVDFPMMWVEAFIPWIGTGGTDVRLGRYISLPDIEAQLAPNNYMYSHSITYTLDNYTNSGLQFTTGVTKNFFLQYGISVGTEAGPWHLGQGINNPTQYVSYTD